MKKIEKNPKSRTPVIWFVLLEFAIVLEAMYFLHEDVFLFEGWMVIICGLYFLFLAFCHDKFKAKHKNIFKVSISIILLLMFLILGLILVLWLKGTLHFLPGIPPYPVDFVDYTSIDPSLK